LRTGCGLIAEITIGESIKAMDKKKNENYITKFSSGVKIN
jgi:hypothetical protein